VQVGELDDVAFSISARMVKSGFEGINNIGLFLLSSSLSFFIISRTRKGPVAMGKVKCQGYGCSTVSDFQDQLLVGKITNLPQWRLAGSRRRTLDKKIFFQFGKMKMKKLERFTI